MFVICGSDVALALIVLTLVSGSIKFIRFAWPVLSDRAAKRVAKMNRALRK